MHKIFHYLLHEGLFETIKKIFLKVVHHNKSTTIFVQKRFTASETAGLINNNIQFIELIDETRANFEAIKFWDFVDADFFISNPNASVLLAKMGNEFIGYAAEQHEIDRTIHGLGKFCLKKGEAWIGPVYVTKKYRGKRINHALINEQMKRLANKKITTFFTCINSNNFASINSFHNAGFIDIGRIERKHGNKRIIIDDIRNILTNQFNYSEI